MESETSLIEEAKQGSARAFSQVLRLHQAELRGYLAGLIRDAEAADDVAQEAFLGAYRSLETFKGDSSFRTWLFAIAKNKAYQYLRDEGRKQAQHGESLKLAVSRWVVEAAERERDSQNAARELTVLEDCVGKLPKTSARLLADHYQNHMTADQIARETGRSEVSVWKTLSRIRQALRQCIELGLSTGVGGA